MFAWALKNGHASENPFIGIKMGDAPIRERFQLGPSTRLEWIVEGDGSIRVVPVALDPITAFRGSGSGGATTRLLADRRHDRQQEA